MLNVRWIFVVIVFLFPIMVSAEQREQTAEKEDALQTLPLRFADFAGENSFFFEEIIKPWGERINRAARGSLPLVYHAKTAERDDPISDIERKRYDIVRLTPGQTIELFPALEVFQLPFVSANAYITSRAMQSFVEEQAASFQSLSVIPLLTFSDGHNLLQLTAKNPDADAPFEARQFLSPSRVTTIFLGALGSKVQQTSPFLVELQYSNPEIDGILTSAFYDNSTRDKTVGYYSFGRAYNPSSNPYMVLLSKDLYLNLHPIQQRAIMNHSRMNFAIWVGKRFDLGYDRFLSEMRSSGKMYAMDKKTLITWQELGKKITLAWVESMAKREIPSQAILLRAQQLLQKYAYQ